jgi:hypothetical protein
LLGRLASSNSRPGRFLGVLFVALTFASLASATAATNFFSFRYERSGANLTLHFDLPNDNANYYILQQGTNLNSFAPVLMTYGGGSNAWGFTVPTANYRTMFWRVQRVPVSAPLDSDGDGLNDLFELSHGLNPLDPSDANSNSGLLDANNQPLTWLGVYNHYFLNNLKIYDVVSREVSSFNFGQPTATYEALSREVSLFTVLGPDANQDGMDDSYELKHGITNSSQWSGFTSDFPNNTGTPLTWLQIYRRSYGQDLTLYNTASREVSVFNFGQPAAAYEAVSREISVSNQP